MAARWSPPLAEPLAADLIHARSSTGGIIDAFPPAIDNRCSMSMPGNGTDRSGSPAHREPQRSARSQGLQASAVTIMAHVAAR